MIILDRYRFPDRVIGLLTAWDATGAASKVSLARTALVWLAPALIGLSLGSTTYMLLNGYKRFFLAAFVADEIEWAHLDVAGPVWSDKAGPLGPKGATGYGARLVARAVELLVS